MRIRVDASYVAVSVKTYEAEYDSGIDWRSVGPKLIPLDRGSDTAKYQTTVTMRAAGDTMRAARKLVLDTARTGTEVAILCNSWETIFGPEFDYSTEIICIISADEEPYSTGNLNETVPTEWVVTLLPIGDMADRYRFSPTQLPARGMAIQSIARDRGGARDVTELETDREAVGFVNEIQTADVEYICLADIAAKAKAWLQDRRSSPFWLENTDCWLFNEDTEEDDLESVYVLDVIDNGPIDKAGVEHGLLVTYGRADLVGYPSLVSMETSAGGEIGDTVQLHPLFSDGEDHSEYCVYASSNTNAATVSDTGLITLVGNGAANVTAAYRGITKTCVAESGLVIGGRVYQTIVIGAQTWMAEALSWANGNYSYPNNSSGNQADFGLLYDYASAASNAPSGWRVPTLADITALCDTAGGGSYTGGDPPYYTSPTGTRLKKSSALWTIDTGTDTVGFAALPAGELDSVNGYNGLNTQALFWSSSTVIAGLHNILALGGAAGEVILGYGYNGFSGRTSRLSVRYIKE